MTNTLSGGTMGVYLAGVSGLYDLLLSRSLVTENPFKHPLVKIKGNHRKAVKPYPRIPLTDVRAILRSPNTNTAIGRRNKAMLALLFGGGLRRSELRNLKVGDILDSSPMVVRLYYTKSSVLSEQPLPDWAGEIVKDYLGDRCIAGAKHDDSLFALSLEGLHKLFKRLCWDAGVIAYSIHSCRVTAINHVIEMGYSDQEVAEFSRHRDVGMVSTYRRRINNITNNPGRRIDYDK